MNRAYRIVWSAARQAWIVASERAGCGGRPPLAVKKVAGAILLLGMTGTASAATYDESQVTYYEPLTLNSGDIANSAAVSSGGTLNVNSGGLASSSNVGGSYFAGYYVPTINVNNGGVATDTSITSGGHLIINSGGSATRTTVNSGGFINVNSGGTAASVTQTSGGALQTTTDATVSGTNALGAFSVSGGQASNVLLENGGYLNVQNGQSADNTTIRLGGALQVYNGGTATQVVQSSGGALQTYTRATVSGTNALGTFSVSNGLAQNLLLENGGSLYVESGDSAVSITLNSNGTLTVYQGGTATDVAQSSGGALRAYTGATVSGTNTLGAFSINDGQANNLLLENGGFLVVETGHSASDSVINWGGTEYVQSGGLAVSTTVNSGGVLNVVEGGTATNVTQNSGGALQTYTGATVSGTNALGAFSVSGGQATDLLLENGGILYVQADGNASGSVIGQSGTQYVSSGGSAVSTTVNSGGRLVVYDGGLALTVAQSSGGALQTYTGATVSGTNTLGAFSVSGGQAKDLLLENGGYLYVEAGGTASGSVIGQNGMQNVSSGGSTVNTIVKAGGYEQVFYGGTANSTLISGGQQYVMNGGVASASTVDGNGYLNNYGSAVGTVLNNGTMYVQNGGSTQSTQVNAGGYEYVNNGGVASATTVNAGASQYVARGGSAVSAILAGGAQTIDGSTTSTIVNSGSYQTINSGGSATGTTVNSNGFVNVRSGGSAIDATINADGVMDVGSGGVAEGTAVNTDGVQNVFGTATSTIVAGGKQYVTNGATANWTTVTDAGFMNVSSGGTASSAIVNSGGTLSVAAGGVATGSALNAGGMLAIADGGIASEVTQASGAALQASTRAVVQGTNALGAFSISGGQANNVLVENGGQLTVNSGDSSSGTVVNAGGTEAVLGTATGTTVNADGKLAVLDGGKAFQATINSGGLLSVSSGGIASDTTVATGGLLNIADGAVLTLANNSFVNEGVTTYDISSNAALNTNLTGSGQLTKSGTGTLTLGGTLSQSQLNLNDGSLVMDGLQAATNIVAVSGTSLSLINSTTLTGIIDPTDVNIDQSSSWNITGDSLVDTLTNAGSIVFVPSQGTFTPHQLTVTNLAGNGGTITLNTVAGDSSSLTDKVIVDGGQATGSTGLQVLNRGGLGAQTTGNGIAVIQAINGATTEAGAFTMTRPLVAGAYSYSLYRNADQSWYLTSQQTDTTSGDITQNGDTSTGDSVISAPVNYRDGMWSYAALPALSLDYDRLLAGTADTRFHYAPDSRIWGRLAAGQLHHPGSGSLSGGSVPESSGAYSFLQIGGDLWQLDGANADWRAGVYGATGLMRNDVWRDGGQREAGTDRDTVYTGGAYLSGRSHSGLHMDGVLQASHHSLKVASNDETRLSTSGTGWLASAEVGQAFTVAPNLALEPQLQYVVQGLSLDGAQDDAASLSWSDSRRQSVRAGLKVGTPQDAKATLAWWVTPSFTQSYGGHSAVTASVPGVSGSEAAFHTKLSGTSVGLDGGVSTQIRKNVTLGIQGGWSESTHGGEAGGYYGLVNLGVSFR